MGKAVSDLQCSGGVDSREVKRAWYKESQANVERFALYEMLIDGSHPECAGLAVAVKADGSYPNEIGCAGKVLLQQDVARCDHQKSAIQRLGDGRRTQVVCR